jgi:L-rhamnose mutarotase
MTADNAPPIYGPTNASPDQPDPDGRRRFGSVFPLNPDNEKLYRELHADTWPGVLARLSGSGFRNYSVFIAELAGQKYVIGYYEYEGTDFEGDMKAIDADPDTQRWLETLDCCTMAGVECGELERVFFLE